MLLDNEAQHEDCFRTHSALHRPSMSWSWVSEDEGCDYTLRGLDLSIVEFSVKAAASFGPSLTASSATPVDTHPPRRGCGRLQWQWSKTSLQEEPELRAMQAN